MFLVFYDFTSFRPFLIFKMALFNRHIQVLKVLVLIPQVFPKRLFSKSNVSTNVILDIRLSYCDDSRTRRGVSSSSAISRVSSVVSGILGSSRSIKSAFLIGGVLPDKGSAPDLFYVVSAIFQMSTTRNNGDNRRY